MRKQTKLVITLVLECPWYTGTEEYIEGRNCPVFVIGTDHEEHFTKENIMRQEIMWFIITIR